MNLIVVVDPIFIPMQQTEAERKVTPVYFTGGIAWSKTLSLSKKLYYLIYRKSENIIAFSYTAGYMMHFNETRSHLYDFTTNLVTSNAANFLLDDEI